jgi:hypothetical protein
MSAASFLAEIDEPNGWPLPLPHVSASSLGTYLRCPEQYRQRYLLGRKEPPNVKLLWGRADHRALEHNWQQKIDSHEDLPVKEVEEAFAVSLDEAVDESGGESEVQWDETKPGDVKDAGVRLVRCYHEQVSPSVQPVQVERKFELLLPGMGVPIVGYIDLETVGPIVERKTAARKFTTVPGRYALQAGIYQLAARRSIDFHVSTKTKLPAVYTPGTDPGLSLPVSDARLRMVEERVRRTVRSLASTYQTFGPDDPWPDAIADDSSCMWCGFGPKKANICPHWNG